jgi:hypothetical protein
MQEWLPLFPLQLVYAAGSRACYAFRKRYKEMTGGDPRHHSSLWCWPMKGIVNTGCTASISKVLREYRTATDMTVGQRRFEILRLNDERCFLRGAVEFR